MIDSYKQAAAQREKQNLPPLPLSPEQVTELTQLLEAGSGEQQFLVELLAERVEPGVTESARIKASWLEKIITQDKTIADLSAAYAVALLGNMGGGYCVDTLIRLLDKGPLQKEAATALKNITKVYDSFDTIRALADKNPHAHDVLTAWAGACWFMEAPALPDSVELFVYKASGEITTDDFSPGKQAHSRTDIPLHATHFGTKRFPGGIEAIAGLRRKGQVVFTGDVVGTGSSRKSAVNSMLWHIGDSVSGVPNKRRGGYFIGGVVAPIFHASARDAGLLPLECDVSLLETGQKITFFPQEWRIQTQDGDSIVPATPPVSLLDEYRAGGRLNLIIGKQLTQRACEATGQALPTCFAEEEMPTPPADQPYTLAQKMLGKACGMPGVLPGMSCLPEMTTVGSQDTTGPMTMQEVDELACQQFTADFFLQSFCHTAAYPKADDLTRWKNLTKQTTDCGGLSLRPGDGVIHTWINRTLLPDTVGTGGDSHTRFPLGISFPAGSSLVAFAAALGRIPLDIPPSVLVRFEGKRRPGITVRDMVHAIPYFAIREGLLTVSSKDKKNIFSSSILEIEGLDDLSVDEAFELADASAERNAAACTLNLPLETVVGEIQNNVALLESLVADGYENRATLEKRIQKLKNWLDKPSLMRRDPDADFLAELTINLDEIEQPLLCCPNNPDDVRTLEDCAGASIDEVFIGSCMTSRVHLKTAARMFADAEYARSRLWIAPTTRMDDHWMKQQGAYATFASVGARLEVPGCSLCMGNQARTQPGATVLSTSTRNYDNRMGDGAQVYLGSAEVAVLTALAGKLPTPEEYFTEEYFTEKYVTEEYFKNVLT